jgi:hypothetical protein
MKKPFLLLIVLSTISFAKSDFYIEPKVGIDLISGYKKTYDDNGKIFLNDKTKEFGVEVAIEGYKILNEYIDLGLGVAYQNHADRKHFDYTSNVDISGVQYTSIPVYIAGKYNFLLDSETKPYLKANLGYSFNFDSSDLEEKNTLNDRIEKTAIEVNGGLYYGIGTGIEYKNYTIELMYAINRCKISNKKSNFKERADYDRISLLVGYRFNF